MRTGHACVKWAFALAAFGALVFMVVTMITECTTDWTGGKSPCGDS